MIAYRPSLSIVVAVIVTNSAVTRAQDDGRLTVADLAAYRAALVPKNKDEPVVSVSFRELWETPNAFRGRSVRVKGRVVTAFHEGAVGQFPALAEVWIFNPASEPICLIFAENDANPAPKLGSIVEFTGAFLRRVRYRGGDVDRFAPLVVGPDSPRVETLPADIPNPTGSPFDSMVLLVVGGLVVLTLLRVALRRPSRAIVDDPAPLFDDSEPTKTDH